MRLQRYINEITKPTTKSAKKIIESHMAEMFRILNKKNWVMSDKDIVSMLNGLFKKHLIVFRIGKRRDKAYKYIEGAQIDASKNLRIDVILKPGIGKAFRQFSKPNRQQMFYDINKNEILSNIQDALSHELLHRQQWLSTGGMAFEITPGTSQFELVNYYKDPTEMEAFAQSAATEMLRLGFSKTFNQVINVFELVGDIKAKNRFVKKVTKFVKELKK